MLANVECYRSTYGTLAIYRDTKNKSIEMDE